MQSHTPVTSIVPDVSLRTNLAQLAFDRLRGGDGAVVGKGLMVGLNKAQVIEVVGHEPGCLAHALGGGVPEEVQPLQAGAVAEMDRATGSSGLPRGLFARRK